MWVTSLCTFGIDIVQRLGYDYCVPAHLYILVHMRNDDESKRLR